MPKPFLDPFGLWTTQVRKGILELCILNALAVRERYGYELAKALAGLPGYGVPEGTLYPLLARLWKQGLVTIRREKSSGGPDRKYYALTPTARAELGAMNQYLADLISAFRAYRQK